MDIQTIIWIVSGWFVLFLLLGQAVATCLFGAGLLGVWLIGGTRTLHGLVASDIFYTTSAYSLSIIPLYLLMAQLLMKGQVITDLFCVGHRLAGYRRFPLGAATIVTGGLLGAVSGSGSASAAALAALAGPELERVGYTRRFGVSLAAVAGSLSAIIPPSLIIIIYGSITMVPVGHLFIGALVPALLVILVYIACLALFGELRPDAADTRPQADISNDLSRAEWRRAFLAFWFVIALMVIVFGGIYGGVITVGEAGAIGAFTALLGMVAMRRVTLADIGQSVVDSVKVTAMIMMLVVSAQIFARFLSLARIPRSLIEVAEPLISQPMLLVAVMLLIIFIAGMILESAALMVLFIPIITPILTAAGVDMLWFGVLASLMITLGLITPPVGLSTYAAATAANMPVSSIFRTTWIFAVAAGVVVAAITMTFPGTITWLPSLIN